MLQLVLRDTLAVLHSILIMKMTVFQRLRHTHCGRNFLRMRKMKISPPKAQALPIKQPRFPTADHTVVSKHRALYSLCV